MRSHVLIAALAASVLSSCSSPSTSPLSPAPNLVARRAAGPGWTMFQILGEVVTLTQGHDGNMWGPVWDGQSYSICRFTLQGQQTCFPGGGYVITAITPNPDGNLYASANSQGNGVAIMQILPSGGETTMQLPNPEDWVYSLITGSDQRIWMSRTSSSNGSSYVAAISTNGQYEQFPTYFGPNRPIRLARGSDKNVWGIRQGPGGPRSGVIFTRFSIADGSPTDYAEPGGQLVEGPDGAFWGPGYDQRSIYRFDPMTGQETSTVVRFKISGIGAFVKNNLHWIQRDSNMYAFNIVKDRLVGRVFSPLSNATLYNAPGHQLWMQDTGSRIYVYQF